MRTRINYIIIGLIIVILIVTLSITLFSKERGLFSSQNENNNEEKPIMNDVVINEISEVDEISQETDSETPSYELNVSNLALTPTAACGEFEMVSQNSEDGTKTVSGSGSGAVISSDGLVVTNYHVIENAIDGKFYMEDSTTNETYEYQIKEVINFSETYDLAVVRIEGENLPCLMLGDSDSVTVEDYIRIIGTPRGIDQIRNSLFSATISKITKYGHIDTIQTSSGTSPGNSGGPVINDDNEIIAIFARSYTTTTIFEMIPINYLKELLSTNIHSSLKDLCERKSYVVVNNKIDTENSSKFIYSNSSMNPAFYSESTGYVELYENYKKYTEENGNTEGYSTVIDASHSKTAFYHEFNKTVGIKRFPDTGCVYFGLMKVLYVDNIKNFTSQKGPAVMVWNNSFLFGGIVADDTYQMNGETVIYDRDEDIILLSERSNNDTKNGYSVKYMISKGYIEFAEYKDNLVKGTVFRFDIVKKELSMAKVSNDTFSENDLHVVNMSDYSRFSIEEYDSSYILTDAKGLPCTIQIQVENDLITVNMESNIIHLAGNMDSGYSFLVKGEDGTQIKGSLGSDSIKFTSNIHNSIEALWENNALYLGENLQDEYSRGAYVKDNNTMYIGQMHNLEASGKGVSYMNLYQFGFYKGMFQNDKPNGIGMYVFNFLPEYGYWEDGEFVKPLENEFYEVYK